MFIIIKFKLKHEETAISPKQFSVPNTEERGNHQLEAGTKEMLPDSTGLPYESGKNSPVPPHVTERYLSCGARGQHRLLLLESKYTNYGRYLT